ncbi:hypothetical protein EYD45_00675 [Hyunsoonleella flava]|uniref:Uncharacterized protein n=1 Tax=Hyunsoonleella flava TaxID=2527939 RepID=A0A4Q9FHM3_9FLAO|nr:hypothetical protein [Hyunsoonleella flava]TBN06431.1 hypothetical protein EYD45_00675 [Hyunsoonleella flava]
MKKIALILGSLFISLGAFAQEDKIVKRSDLKGPAYKNYKPWKHKTIPTVVYTVERAEKVTGPAYKNYKPWRDDSKKELAVVEIGKSERQKLKGPAYKNYKPWKKKAK